MGRNGRSLFPILATLSLLVSMVIGVVWGRSYWWSDQILWQRTDGLRMVRSAQGRLVLEVYMPSGLNLSPGVRYRQDEPGWANNYLLFMMPDWGDRDVSREWGGMAWYEKRKANGYYTGVGVMPFWMLMVVAAGPAVGWGIWRGRFGLAGWRRKRGLCVSCGYDLRETPKRCPECGTAVTEKPEGLKSVVDSSEC